MRIKTLKRNSSNVTKRAAQYMFKRINEINLNLNVLLRLKKELERELDESLYYSSSSENAPDNREEKRDETFYRDVKTKLESVCKNINERYQEIATIEARYQEFCLRVRKTGLMNISRLMVELDTGGNIRLEEGKNGDVWFHSCVDLVKSRFFAHDFEDLDIKNLRVTRVTRIHNRFLRNRFEQQLDSMVDTTDPNYKRSLEYLFYGESLDPETNLFAVIEEGFPSARAYKKRGFDASVSLSNSVSICEVPRLLKLHSDAETIEGSLLIAKVFLGSFTSEKPGTRERKTPRKNDENSNSVSQENYPNYDSVYRVKPDDTKQRTWFIFDHQLIMPEYLVEYELEKSDFKSPKKRKEDEPSELILRDLAPTSEVDAVDIRSHAVAYQKFVKHCITETDPVDSNDICSITLSMPPSLKARKKINVISQFTLTQIVPPSEPFQNLTYLNLYGNNIRKIEGLETMINLQILVLSFNEIQKIEGLDELTKLQKLELGFNLIKKIEGLGTLSALTHLELNNNLLYRLEDLQTLRQYPLSNSLMSLNLKNNAICEIRSYKHMAIRRLPNLIELDGIDVTSTDRALAQEKLTSISYNMISQAVNNKITTPVYGQFEVPTTPTSPIKERVDMEDSWIGMVSELDLSDKGIRTIQNLEKLTNMRSLNLANNEISRIEGLHECMKIQELSLENNRIVRIEGLSSLLSLRKLELGKNKISKLENLDLLARLSQLSLEDNEIDSLQGIDRLVNLMELYIGNNRIKSLQEVMHMKNLPKLIILDLSGNPVCNCNVVEDEVGTGDNNWANGVNMYRLFSIFHLKKLKVLDGVSIDVSEVNLAKEEFSGKMTRDILIDRTYGSTNQTSINFANITVLNLNNSNLKTLTNQLEEFVSLRELNLDHNLIHSINGLQNVTWLTVLRLSYNRIEAAVTANNTPLSNAFGKVIEKLVHLEVLTLDNNHIASIAALQLGKLRKLRLLSIKGNSLTRVDGLDGLVSLEKLFVDRNKIRGLEDRCLLAVPNLQELHMDDNSLRSLDGIRPLSNLIGLYCNNNRISEVVEIEKLVLLKRLRDMYLLSNPIVKKQLYRMTVAYKIPSVHNLDGKEITPEERERAMIMFNPDYYHPMLGANSQMQQYQQHQMMMQQQQQLTNANLANNMNTYIQQQQQQYQNENQVINPNINSRVPVRVSSLNFEYGDRAATAGNLQQSQPNLNSTTPTTFQGYPPVPSNHYYNTPTTTVVSPQQLQQQQLLTTTPINSVTKDKTGTPTQQREYDRFLMRASSTSRKSLSRTSGLLGGRDVIVSGTPPTQEVKPQQQQAPPQPVRSNSGGTERSNQLPLTAISTNNGGSVINVNVNALNSGNQPSSSQTPSAQSNISMDSAFQVKKVPMSSGFLFSGGLSTKPSPLGLDTSKSKKLSFGSNTVRAQPGAQSSHHFKMQSNQNQVMSLSNTPRSNMFPKV